MESEPRYGFVYHEDHRQYHTDLKTAELLATAKQYDRAVYQHVFERGRDLGRIAEGPAPAVTPDEVRKPGTQTVLERAAASPDEAKRWAAEGRPRPTAAPEV